MSLAVIRAERLAKLQKIRDAGQDPFGSRVERTDTIAAVRERCPAPVDHDAPPAESVEAEIVTVAGRVMAIRNMGKSCWLDVRDQSGKIQVNFLHKRLGDDAFALVKLIDVGDIIEAVGELSRSRVGEITIFSTGFRFLSKSIEPLPAKWSGLKDVEVRFRRRYLDLIANDASRERFILRSRIISHIRRWLDARAFLEVETPMLQAVYGGAAAKPFVTHHNALGMDLYLRISPETYLKRLLVGGLDRVYELNRNFRNEGIDTSHNPEFTMIEIYQAYADFTDMMTLTETLVADTAQTLLGTTRIQFGEHAIDVKAPWPRRSIHDLIRDVGGVDPADDGAMLDRLVAARAFGAEKAAAVRASLAAGGETAALARDQLLKECMDELVEPKLVQPTFVTHHPASLNPLCKRNKDNPELSDRFEVIVAGFELANAFSELNDPIEQRARFEAQINPDDEEAYCNAVDDDYVSALEVGLPPAGGLGIGIDRLVMLLTGQPSIREVVLFPTLKPKTQAEIMAGMEEAEESGEPTA